jgi:signal transduction histidine kinase
MAKEEIATDLAAFLERHQSEIAAAWAEKAHQFPHSCYAQYALSEVIDWTFCGLAAIIQSLNIGSPEAIEDHLNEIVLDRLEGGFDISEVIECLLLIKEATLPIIERVYPAGSPQASQTITQLDACLRHTVGRFGSLYAEAMRHDLQKQQEQTAILLDTSESLQRVTSTLLQKLTTLDEALRLVCVEARHLSGAAGSALMLLEDDGRLRVACSSGTPLPDADNLPMEGSIAGRVLTQGKPLLLTDPDGQVHLYQQNKELMTLLAIPLRVKDRLVGVIDVVNKPGGFTTEDSRIMRLFANQVAIAIENIHLSQQAERLAVIEERQRLARELHDSVTQALYTVSLYADAARLALSAGKQEVAADNLRELRSMAREAMLDMRLLVFELRPPILEKEGLVVALQARLDAVETRSGVHTEFQVEGESSRLTHPVEEAIYRIVQETLTNVVKHAQAQHVKVYLRFSDHLFCLKVEDDGVGFDLDAAQLRGGLGLRTMQERVQRIGGNLSLASTAGKGTTLRVEIET